MVTYLLLFIASSAPECLILRLLNQTSWLPLDSRDTYTNQLFVRTHHYSLDEAYPLASFKLYSLIHTKLHICSFIHMTKPKTHRGEVTCSASHELMVELGQELGASVLNPGIFPLCYHAFLGFCSLLAYETLSLSQNYSHSLEIGQLSHLHFLPWFVHKSLQFLCPAKVENSGIMGPS